MKVDRLRRRAAAVALAASLLLAVGGARAAAGDGSDAAGQFVAELAREIVETYRQGTSADAAHAQIVTVFEHAVDVGGMAAAVLGRRWPTATPAEQDRFVALLRERAVTALERRLAAHDEAELCVTGAEALGEARFFVRGQTCGGDGEQRRLGWLVVREGDAHRIRDFVVDGSSFVAIVREESAAVLSRSGGSIAALIDAMEQARAQ